MTELSDRPAMTAAGEPAAPYCYRLYGLELWSDIELPELVASLPARSDLNLRLARIDREPPPGNGGNYFEFMPAGSFFMWEAVGKFLVTGNRLIEVEPASGVDERLLAFPLLGPVLAMTLHARGAFVLHASAVAVDGHAVAFLGDKGAGKSTTAAAMIAAGHELLSDDILALTRTRSGQWSVEAGFPQLKLSTDTATAIRVAGADVRLPPHTAIPKLLHRLTSGFSTSPVPLSRIFVLRRGDRPAIEKLRPKEAFTALAKFSYCARFGTSALNGDTAGRHLAAIGALLKEVDVCRLEVPERLERLGETVRLVEADLDGGSST